MKTSKKLLAFLLSAALLVSALIVPGMAVSAVDPAEIDVWNGTTADAYAGGDGLTPETAFQISNGAQLAKMVQEGNGKYYILTNDIYLNNVYDADGKFNSDWTASATNSWAFPDKGWQGSLNGNGNIIYGLYNAAASGASGLVAGVGRNDGTVKNTFSNLGIRYCYIKGAGQVGAFVGQADAYKEGAKFYNCFVDDTVTLSSSDQYAGGIAGFCSRRDDSNTGWYLENCYSLANVSAPSYRNAGKLANGYSANMTFKNCYTNGSIMTTAKNEYAPYTADSYVDCYGTVAAAANANGTWNVLTIDQMTGTGALDNMPALSKDVWTAVDGMTPVLTIFLDKLVVPEEPEEPEVPVEDENGIWNGNIAESFADDSVGTEGDPILIQNADELALAVKNGGQGKFYQLTKDIYLNDVSSADWANSAKNSWDFNTEFQGTIDGGNNIIYGLYANSSNSVGLVAKASRYTADFKNLGIRYANLTSSDGAGAFVGKIEAYNGNSTITNCFVDETVVIRANYAAGFVGYMARQDAGAFVNIDNCYSLADAATTSGRGQGKFVTGYNGRWQVTNSYTVGMVSQTKGNANYTSKISDAFTTSYGTVEADSANAWNVITLDQMTGYAAEANMTNLNFETTWMAVKGSTPVLRQFADKLGAEEDVFVPVEDENGIWNGNISATFTDNSEGTASDPIEIQNAGELALAVKNNGQGKYYKLTKDIYLNDVSSDNWAETAKNNWADITGNNKFSGTIDGDGHIIYGLYINTADNAGLVAQVPRAGATFTKLGIRYANINASGAHTGAGAFVGKADEYGAKATISQCFVDETVSVNGFYAAGMVGYMTRNDGTESVINIDNSYSLAVITASQNGSKFVNAYNGRYFISNSYTDGQVGNTGGNDAYVSKVNPAYTNCYGHNNPSLKDTNNGNTWTVLAMEDMTGTAALENMDLDFEGTWAAAKGTTPVLTVFAENLGAITETYTVTYQNEDGSVYDIVTAFVGDTAEAPEAPSKEGNAQYSYVFAGWEEVAANTFKATFTETVNEYTVQFIDEDGTVLDTQTLEYGATPVAPAPTKAADAQFTYTFAGWDNDVVAVEGNATYTATYTATPIEYTVTFKNEDGSVFATQTYHYGDAIVAPAEVPTKAADETYTYEFAGWGELGTVEDNAEFTATFNETYIDYTVVFKDWNGDVISSETYHYGDAVVVPADPTRANEGNKTFTFAGWDSEVVAVAGDAVYTATYTEGVLYTMADVDALRVAILNGTEGVDVNADDVVDILDLVAMYNMVA